MPDDYDEAVRGVVSILTGQEPENVDIKSHELEGFVFAATSKDGRLTATPAANEEKASHLNITELVGSILLSTREAFGVDPAELAQAAASWVQRKDESDEPVFVTEHDKPDTFDT